MDITNRDGASRIVRAVLAADMACEQHDLNTGAITVVSFEARPDRRKFPIGNKPFCVVSMGTGIVVTTHSDRLDWMRTTLSEMRRDDVFSAGAIERISKYIKLDGQSLWGPDLKFVCSNSDPRPFSVPSGVEIALVVGNDIHELFRYKGFGHALSYRKDSPRPDILATVATRDKQVVGIAAASADCDAMWQIGVDVVENARGSGVGRALVGRLTQAVLDEGRLPYYSTVVSNIPSNNLAISLGYWQAWVEMGAVDL